MLSNEIAGRHSGTKSDVGLMRVNGFAKCIPVVEVEEDVEGRLQGTQ